MVNGPDDVYAERKGRVERPPESLALSCVGFVSRFAALRLPEGRFISMAPAPRILIAGGYGVFGHLLARELLETTDAGLVLAGRDRRRAERAAAELHGERVEAIQLDLREPGSLSRAAEGCFAVACAAGPFQALSRELPLEAI